MVAVQNFKSCRNLKKQYKQGFNFLVRKKFKKKENFFKKALTLEKEYHINRFTDRGGELDIKSSSDFLR